MNHRIFSSPIHCLRLSEFSPEPQILTAESDDACQHQIGDSLSTQCPAFDHVLLSISAIILFASSTAT